MKFKKLAAAGLAAISAVSVFTFTACDNGEGGYGEEKSAKEATKVISKLEEIESNGISVNGNFNLRGQLDVKVELSAQLNASAGAFDFKLGTIPQTQLGGYNYARWQYYFMRDWKIYDYSTIVVEETDFTDITTLTPVVDVSSALNESGVPTTVLAAVPMVINMAMTASNYTLLSFGKATNSIAYKDNTITLDYNLALNNMLQDVKSVVDGLTPATTVGDILGNVTLKKYAQIFTELVGYEDLVSTVTMIKAMLAAQLPAPAAEDEDVYEGDDVYIENVYPDMEESVTVALVLVDVLDNLLKSVTPDKNSSTYDYLVKLISSDELKNIINEFYMQTSTDELLTKNLDKYTVKELASFVSEQELTDEQVNALLDGVKAEVAAAGENITAEKAVINEGTQSVEIVGCKYSFSYDSEYILRSQSLEGTLAVSDTANPSNNMGVTFKLDIEYSKDLLLLVQLPATLPAFPEYGDNVIE